MKRAMTFVCAVMTVGFARPAIAVDTGKESEDACTESAKAGLATPQMVVKKVDEFAALVAKEGKAVFPKLKGKNSSFIFGGTYIFVNDLEGKNIVHPVKPVMEGKVLTGLKDTNGKYFFVEMGRIAAERGSGWTEYLWPKPGEKESTPKVTYVKLVKHGKDSYVIGCGINDLTLEDIKKAGLPL